RPHPGAPIAAGAPLRCPPPAGGRDRRPRSTTCYGQVLRRDQESALACWGIDQ
ncbi:hypothetical protein NQU33_25485, partial [Escherichia coli]|nr:hypothetical protein [Escherichia coli]